jgi:hypothetical protein
MKPVPDLLRLLLLLVAGSGSLSGGERNDFGESGGGRHCSFSPELRSLNCSLPSLTALTGNGGGGNRVSFLDAFPAAAAARTIHIRCDGWEEGETEVEEREGVEGPSGRPFSGLGGLERLELEQCRQVSLTENRF